MAGEIDFRCLFNPSISFQEVQAFMNLTDVNIKLSNFLKSENSSQISFQANAHLGFLFSSLQEKELADYISNTVFSEILLANYDSLQSMPQVINDWGNVASSEYVRIYRFCLDLRQNYQFPLVESISQIEYSEELKIDNTVVKVRIAFETGPIEASAIIKETGDKPVAKEIIMYMQKGYPRFYGILSNVMIQDRLCRLTFFSQHTITFKQDLLTFYKIKKNIRDSEKNEREALALNYYQQLIVELNNYRECELFHNNICPSSILIYNNIETSGEFRVFLFNGKCKEFKLENGITNSFPINLDFEKKNKRYIAPEIVYMKDYCDKYNIDCQNFSYNVSDAWSLAACILNFTTDASADKWNNLNFSQSLIQIINIISNERLKNLLSRSLDHNLNLRLKINDAL